MRKRIGLVLTIITVTGLSAAAMYLRSGDSAPAVTTGVVSRGSIVSVISATGTLEAVGTVQVGSQVSGVVQTLHADYNAIVKRGQVLARLDPSLIQAEIQRARANLTGAEADLEQRQVMLADATTKLARAKDLAARQLIPANELDAAEIALRTTEAQVKSAQAQVTQARAAVSQSEVNLAKTVITSPIDGIVISRAVDLGQTVAASLQAPTLFTIAADLRQMRLNANIDESDLGAIHDGQTVSFRVDAYPSDVFEGTVTQVRLQPAVVQNVVTYAAIVSAANPELKLKPGMTATLEVEVARRDNVLRVPSAALRFKPAAAVLAAFGAAETEPVRAVGTSGADVPASAGGSGRPGTVWTYLDDRLHKTPVTTGISDATFTEIVGGDVAEGAPVVTQVTMPGSANSRPAVAPTSNPLMGQTPRRM
jgi:HlyD family secretion protein